MSIWLPSASKSVPNFGAKKTTPLGLMQLREESVSCKLAKNMAISLPKPGAAISWGSHDLISNAYED